MLKKPMESHIRLRVSEEIEKRVREAAIEDQADSVSDWLRDLIERALRARGRRKAAKAA
jgi:predicted HicB family RNase H-like nuclease